MYAIIGAGIGGLTTALAFEKLNIEYQLFEKSEGINALGAGIWLAPNALQVYEWLGILNQIQEGSNAIDRITLSDSQFIPLSDSLQDGAKKTFGYSTVAIHRVTLQKILYQNLPADKVHWNKGVSVYKENTDSVEITFEDQSSTTVNYLIGADGINSVIRRQLFPEGKIRYSGQTCWRGITQHQLPEDFDHRGFEMWGKKVRFGISKVTQDTTYWFAVANSPAMQKDDKETLHHKLTELYADFDPVVSEIIQNTEIEAILRNDIIDLKPLKKWHSDRVCLLGDAGHATTPNMGQGGAQAIEDAYFLSRIIADSTIQNNFETFQKKRYPKVQSIVNQSWQTGQIAHLPFGTGLRNWLFRRIPKSLIDKKMNFVYTLEG